MQRQSVIVAAKRTPIGAFQGNLSSVLAPKLGAIAIKAVVEETGIDKSQINEVIMGNVLSAGIGQAPARQASIQAGLPNSVEALTINKMCGSGLKAVMMADQVIRGGDADVVIAGGMESMSNAPYLLQNARAGQRLGHGKMIDSMIHDGLWDAYNDTHMGNCAEMLSKDRNYTREAQDEFAVISYKRAQKAQAEGVFDSEIVSVEIPQRNGNPIKVLEDEEPGKARFDKISTLRPAFEKDGAITAANASKLNDGAAAVLIMSAEKANELGLSPIARINAQASAAHEPEWFTTAPGKAIGKVLKKANLSANDIGLWEINEAFSVVTMATIDDFKIDPAKVNIYGGAVAIGHPIGASGARIFTTLMNGMVRTETKYGLATLCIGGGEASALIVEKV
ncbi:MAG: acetyl-CoA C-acetyltransferase [Candidatus Marinimicrobia bacterium]|jgi:acetyl-CoA C-acetyltransferase|nr:acetyl-CoA C-acetyltransferase [Candidatus Neomarinimicrobiota bacterium]MBT3849468.1 acetyl-CoA C-acetyltransferase [Candidatus Neomarinimicrobiota bacterium]MBT4054386.1 acetyl-CoA C-acetyltransferase [Candidatus Neomarinimicrobiota bacterium]MBT4662223.1 acetyl-CoA C-acetyltransferase [Candidatus Neomarinimicrobiota bacterium]MBT5223900.1 acetyl-CoA C-acetyltransferase [Candidatus Neomarinimicrobiota bacterium]